MGRFWKETWGKCVWDELMRRRKTKPSDTVEIVALAVPGKDTCGGPLQVGRRLCTIFCRIYKLGKESISIRRSALRVDRIAFWEVHG